MLLEDKYHLKNRASYKHYKDEVLDFITAYVDAYLDVFSDVINEKQRESINEKIIFINTCDFIFDIQFKLCFQF